MDTPVSIVKKGGRIYRIPKNPFEFNDTACERGWYVVNGDHGFEVCEANRKALLSLSNMHLNKVKAT
jgi:hypothetical protein